ncbi:hypothetical protein D0Z07_7395 [Hyphodiscus hymeniophilus]|uniref:Chlorophyllase n=1 Tax=Hyphodiscus hymeniophilus TaxID=353542 RepID=A0A9P7AUR2_9HELO|nr:hypothetical protein D0Z07_7395 [Hyphodiscus hymeniophilus]
MTTQASQGVEPYSLPDHALIGEAKNIQVDAATPVVTISPLIIPAPGRLVPLQIKVSAPTTGTHLPILLLSHGHGRSNNLSSLNGYAPLANFWASHGFIVIQPTHLSSKSLSLDSETPGAPLFWRSRVEDMKHILDHLDLIEDSFTGVHGRLDRSRVAVAGHSAGTHTAGMLLGQQLTDEDGTVVDLLEPRIKAGVLLGALGNGGDDLSESAFKNFPFARHPDFSSMKTPTLVVTGDLDISPHFTIRGADWHADPYTLGPSPKSLLSLINAWHIFGGISGYDARETEEDESPERVGLVQRLTWAYLRSALYPGDSAWSTACAAFEKLDKLGKIENK